MITTIITYLVVAYFLIYGGFTVVQGVSTLNLVCTIFCPQVNIVLHNGFWYCWQTMQLVWNSPYRSMVLKFIWPEPAKLSLTPISSVDAEPTKTRKTRTKKDGANRPLQRRRKGSEHTA